MEPKLFHIFRNTPLGRETLLQSVYFCKTVGADMEIYIPEHTKFLMYFENDVVQIDLDPSYLTAPETARDHAGALAEAGKIRYDFLAPKHFTASTLPDIPTHFDFMCCPRSISDLSSKIGLGYIGPRVRRIVQSAHFPVLLTSSVFKPWRSIAVFFGGSTNAVKSLKLGLRLARITGLPLKMYTQVESDSRADYEKAIADHGLETAVAGEVTEWRLFEAGDLEVNLYEVDHDALAIMGAFGHGVVRDVLFGSKMEKIQGAMPNTLLIVGPKYAAIH